MEAVLGLFAGNTSLAAFGAALIAFIGLILKVRRDGGKSVKQEIQIQTLEEQLEMQREATDIERRVADLTDAEVKAKLMKRAKK